jgi:hypothetical protein
MPRLECTALSALPFPAPAAVPRSTSRSVQTWYRRPRESPLIHYLYEVQGIQYPLVFLFTADREKEGRVEHQQHLVALAAQPANPHG